MWPFGSIVSSGMIFAVLRASGAGLRCQHILQQLDSGPQDFKAQVPAKGHVVSGYSLLLEWVFLPLMLSNIASSLDTKMILVLCWKDAPVTVVRGILAPMSITSS